jgi:hypothetical protein
LSTNYQLEVDQWLHKSLSKTSLSKRDFYQLFRPAWQKSFSVANIQGGFKKAGIWPFSPPTVLNTITRRPETPPSTQDDSTTLPPTPMTSKSIRRAQKAYKLNPTKENLQLILRSQERLAAQHEVDRHIQSGLLETIKKEKKKRKRGKKLNLVGEEDTGAQLFHSLKVRAALAYQAEKEAKERAEKAEKDIKKAVATENKKRKAQEAEERALQRQVAKDIRAQNVAEKLAVKEAKKQQPEQSAGGKKQSLIVVLLLKKPASLPVKTVAFAKEVEVVLQVEGSKSATTRTRRVNLPARFKK